MPKTITPDDQHHPTRASVPDGERNDDATFYCPRCRHAVTDYIRIDKSPTVYFGVCESCKVAWRYAEHQLSEGAAAMIRDHYRAVRSLEHDRSEGYGEQSAAQEIR
jgi:transcription elongation factor Elf1